MDCRRAVRTSISPRAYSTGIGRLIGAGHDRRAGRGCSNRVQGVGPADLGEWFRLDAEGSPDEILARTPALMK